MVYSPGAFRGAPHTHIATFTYPGGASVEAEIALRVLESVDRLHAVVDQLADTVLNMRKTPALADALGQRALLSIAVAARRKDR